MAHSKTVFLFQMLVALIVAKAWSKTADSFPLALSDFANLSFLISTPENERLPNSRLKIEKVLLSFRFEVHLPP